MERMTGERASEVRSGSQHKEDHPPVSELLVGFQLSSQSHRKRLFANRDQGLAFAAKLLHNHSLS